MACNGCPKPPEPQASQAAVPPSFPRQALAVMTAAAKFALGGMRVLSVEDQAARMKACEGCPHKKGDMCASCGCILSIKSWMPGEHCPTGRWPIL